MEVSARIVTLELAETFVISRSARDTEEVVVVELRHSGVSGFGEAQPIGRYDESAESALAYAEEHAELLGDDPFALEEVMERLPPREFAARAAVDAALHDLQGKLLGQPVWRLLGGAKKTVPAYITFGLLDFDRDQLVEFARQFLAEGQDKFKMVVAIDNGENIAEDAARVAAVREAIGANRDLMIDGNYLFSMNRALQLARRVEQYDITWFEEPLYGNDACLLA